MGKTWDPSAEEVDVAVVFAGGNALGAYHLGAAERLARSGLAPRWFVGTSIGAITAAILVGNTPEEGPKRLRAFWDLAVQRELPLPGLPNAWRARINTDFALAALLLGRPGLFRSRYPGLWSLLPGMPPDIAIRDHRPLAHTLERLIDFGRLRGADVRFSFNTLDLESGEEVWFDNRTDEIRAEHLLAATALAPLFPPVEIDGRLLGDAGFGNNLPVDRVFREELSRDTLCIAVDLYNASHRRPSSLDETVARVQDIAFALQARRGIEAVRRERELLRRFQPESPSVALGHLALRAPGHQRTLKPLDFSRASLNERTRQGYEDADLVLRRLAETPRGEAFAYITAERDTGAVAAAAEA